MKKWIESIMLSSAIVLLLGGSLQAAETLTLHSSWPKDSKWFGMMEAAAEQIEDDTGGRVVITITDKADADSDGGILAGRALTDLSQDALAYVLPLQFRSDAEAAAASKVLDKKVIEGCREEGYSVLATGSAGFAYLMASESCRTVSQFRKLKVWVPEGDPAMTEAMRAFQCKAMVERPVGDVLDALNGGEIEAVVMSPLGCIALKWQTRVRYLLDMPFTYLYVAMAVKSDALAALDKKDRDVVVERLAASFGEALEEIHEKDREAMDVLLKQGVEFVLPDTGGAAQWYAAAGDVAAAQVEAGGLDEAALHDLAEALSAFRTGAPPPPASVASPTEILKAGRSTVTVGARKGEVTGKSRMKSMAKRYAMRQLRKIVDDADYDVTSITYEDRKDLKKWVCRIQFTY